MTAERHTKDGPWQELLTDLVVDDPRVRCWVERSAPGEQRPAHTHSRPWLTVVVAGGRAEVTVEGEDRATPVDLPTGRVTLNELPDGRPVRHALRNVGERELVLVAVELG